jgi:hypothetical protein
MTAGSFSGRESWVFRAAKLEELYGHHPDLIGNALRNGEPILYLAYSPFRDARGMPFGIKALSGSYGVALTDTRVLVSHDPHNGRGKRSVRSVRLTEMPFVQLGEALTLGWLQFGVPGHANSAMAIPFHATGTEVFRVLVRACRSNGVISDSATRPKGEWSSKLEPSPPYLRDQLWPVALDAEQCCSVVFSPERCGSRSGRRPTCLCGAALFVLTDVALIIAESERPAVPGMLVFAVNVTCLSRAIIRRFALFEQAAVPEVVSLRLWLGAGSDHRYWEYILGRDAAERVAAGLRTFTADERAG